MAVLIDASILIEAERGRLDLGRHIAAHDDAESFLSVITASELLHGVHRASDADVRAKRSAFVEGILQHFALVDVDIACARAHSRIWADLRSAGSIIGPHDLWLAATCVAHGMTIVTANLREFERVPGLMVELWTDESDG